MLTDRPHPRHRSRRDPRCGFPRIAGGISGGLELKLGRERLRANCNALVRLHVRSGSGESVVIYWRRQRLAVLHGYDDCDCVSVRRRQAYSYRRRWVCRVLGLVLVVCSASGGVPVYVACSRHAVDSLLNTVLRGSRSAGIQ